MINIDQKLKQMHRHLMYLKFPYHSVSVIHRPQDLGFCVIFSKDVKDKVNDELLGYMKAYEFEYKFI